MTILEVKTRLTFEQLLDSLPQLTADELTYLVAHASTLQKRLVPSDTSTTLLRQWEQIDTTGWTALQLVARQRILDVIKTPNVNQTRLLGLGIGLVDCADDFDAPLPSQIEALFWGSETDRYGCLSYTASTVF